MLKGTLETPGKKTEEEETEIIENGEIEDWEEEEELTDCLRCGVLLPENSICPQCELDHNHLNL